MVKFARESKSEWNMGRIAGIKEAVNKLKKWHKTGEHLISDKAIQALKEWGITGGK